MTQIMKISTDKILLITFTELEIIVIHKRFLNMFYLLFSNYKCVGG